MAPTEEERLSLAAFLRTGAEAAAGAGEAKAALLASTPWSFPPATMTMPSSVSSSSSRAALWCSKASSAEEVESCLPASSPRSTAPALFVDAMAEGDSIIGGNGEVENNRRKTNSGDTICGRTPAPFPPLQIPKCQLSKLVFFPCSQLIHRPHEGKGPSRTHARMVPLGHNDH